MSLPIAGIAAALLKGLVIELKSACHELRWNADAIEIRQLRESLANVAGNSGALSLSI